MAKLIIKKENLALTSGKYIAEICKPLNKLGITSFNYVRTYDDGSQINLTNIPAWLEYFYKNEFYRIGAFERHPSQYESGYALWPHLSGQKIFFDARSYFNIDNGITLIEKQLDSCDFYYFGTTTNNSAIINFYLNNIDLLKRFILYFKDRANSIIKKASQNRIVLPNHFDQHESPNKKETYTLESFKKEFLKETAIKNLRLTGDLEGELLTSKQLGCIIYLIEGKTAKEIAKILRISYRTVEGHINKLKIRFNCNTKNQLISKLLKNGLGIYRTKCNIIA